MLDFNNRRRSWCDRAGSVAAAMVGSVRIFGELLFGWRGLVAKYVMHHFHVLPITVSETDQLVFSHLRNVISVDQSIQLKPTSAVANVCNTLYSKSLHRQSSWPPFNKNFIRLKVIVASTLPQITTKAVLSLQVRGPDVGRSYIVYLKC